MSYYPAPGAPYVPQQPVNPYGGMGTVGLTASLPNTQMQQAQPQRPQPMNARAVIDNCNANYRAMMDYFTQDKIATLTAENQNLKFAASQDRQNALLTTVMSQQTDTILNRVNPRPIPAYQVANPNVGVNCCGCC